MRLTKGDGERKQARSFRVPKILYSPVLGECRLKAVLCLMIPSCTGNFYYNNEVTTFSSKCTVCEPGASQFDEHTHLIEFLDRGSVPHPDSVID